MSSQPWLESLSDDWVSLPGTPTSPVPTRSLNHSRRSSIQNTPTPSRIPIPARRSLEQQSPLDGKKKVSRPCHFVRKEPPTPKTPRTPKRPLRLRSPVPDKSKNSPKPNLPSERKQRAAMATRSPLRSVSNVASQSGQQSTVQVRPKKGKETQSTPEWRKRLVEGELPSGEQRDLFAPIGLESVFKPPTPGSDTIQHEAIPNMKQSGGLWNLNSNSGKKHKRKPSKLSLGTDGGKGRSGDDSFVKNRETPTTQLESRDKDNAVESPPGSPKATLDIKKGSEKSTLHEDSAHDTSQNEIHGRTASGLEDLRNEGITPITFSRMNTVNVNAEVIKSALKQATNKLEGLSGRWERPDSRASDSVLLHQQSDFFDILPEEDLLDATSHSLPQDLSTGTLDYRGRGAFVNLRSEQYLSERSFHMRQLSPPSLPSQRLSPFPLSTSRIRSSPPFYNKPKPMAAPPAFPRPSSAHVKTSTIERPGGPKEVMPSSGSPLKLFGNHDTFTNNKLLRRMSQFEETFGDLSEEDEPVSPSEEARRKGENRTFLNVKQDTPGERSARRHERPRSRNTMNPRINRFGDGELDNFDFSDTSPYEPKLLNTDIEARPSSRGRVSIGRQHFQRSSHRIYSRETETNNPNLKRNSRARPRSTISDREYLHHSEAEWTLNTPAKDPTPKRRRTILKSDSSSQEDHEARNPPDPPEFELSLLQRSLIQHGMESGDDEHLLEPGSTQRPRTPTPSQMRSSARKRSHSTKNESYHDTDDQRNQRSPSEPTIPMLRVTGVNEEIRRGSITTQDFLNEATKIMDFIRAKGKNTGGLSSVEESETEDKDEDDSYEDESTQEEFSRPPSRDGVDMRKLREPKEPNPRVLSHLKKFQEHDDLEFGDNASVISLHLDTENAENEQRKRKLPTLPVDDQDDGLPDLLTINTHISSKSFSARSIPTGSSFSSHSKGVLSSDLVSHLIPEQVNGLTYDRSKHQWVKETPKRSPEKPRNEDSDSLEDPFRGIPDLSVDELQEMMRVHSLTSPERVNNSTPTEEGEEFIKSPVSIRTSSPQSEIRPRTGDGEPSVNASTLRSKMTRFTSSVPNSGTGVTSWGTNEQKARETSSEVEHEIQLHEGRLSKPPQHLQDLNHHQARVVTISFSSPLVSQVTYSDDKTSKKSARGEENNESGVIVEQSTTRAHSSRSSFLKIRRESVDGQPFIRRPISRIDEGGEDMGDGLFLVQRSRGPIESTPKKNCIENSLVRLSSPGHDSSYSFHLSPLPDFTIDQIDQPLHLEVSYVAQRTHPTSLRQVHGTFALATEDLIKHITEAEPFEPYWEHVRRLILRDKGLITLHKLKDFCPRLEDLDVSDNDIGQLSGVPSSLRTLKIPRNCLSNLTAWGHLFNLQYLDVSGNELESLDGFSSLIHLRELKASENNIRNIDGILDLNGLLSLKLSNNSLTALDFEGAELTRLQELDLSHNQLISVRNIDSLRSLSTLDLSFNQVSKLGVSSPFRTLQSLKLTNNQFHSLDAGTFPSLALLYLDQNFLSTVSGLEQCRGLEILSVREQMISDDHNSGYFDINLGLVKDVRKVFLSSNKLSMQTLSPSAPLLNLHLFDAASCGLQSLPVDFALSFPNVKVLNLNFNSLTSISELVGMNCLSRLTVAGNSITRLRRLCQVLSQIGRRNKGKVSSLHKVDIRGNPLTVRFYPPAVTGSGKDADRKKLRADAEERRQRVNSGVDLPSILADFGSCGSTSIAPIWGENEEVDIEKDIEINDPYTLPPADTLADMKYLSHLDEPTRLRRKVFELMLYAGTGGAIKFLDGLELRPTLEEGSDMDRAWTRLEKLGVLKKKAIAA